ncbi:MAG: Smr/MutS family protein [Proteobacteria bacterium]|nr:Smr/MutS family protein [Pseudomonadota bacterium]
MPLFGFDRRDLDKVLSDVAFFAETAYGKETVLKLPVLQSLNDILREQERLKKVQELLVKNAYQIPYIDDIRGYLDRTEKIDFLTEEEAGFIYINLSALVSFFERYENLKLGSVLDYDYPYKTKLKDAQKDLSGYLTERGKININCSEELKKIFIEKDFFRESIVSKLEKLMNFKTKIFQDKYYTIRDGRYVLPVKANFKKDIKGTIRDTSQSGDTFFIEPEIISDLNDKLVFAEKREEIEKRKILLKVTDIIKKNLREIREGLYFFGYVDSLIARVKYLLRYDLYLPEICENSDISLYNAYHPLFISKSDVVKNDFVLPKDKKIFLITGPNGGGKTVSIKTIMMITLLTHMAVPVSASEKSRVSFYKRFCFDMEDKQSIEAGVSSFTSKMLLWKDIIDNLSEDTIVFIDELGNFTNPEEGSAISIALLDYLVKKGGKVIAGTHIDEIKEYVFSREDGIVSSMLWDNREHRPTYKISYGFYSGSFAIEVLKKLGFQRDFIESCEKNLANDYIYIEELKKKREKEYLDSLELKEALESKKKELEKIEAERLSLLKRIEDEKYNLLKKSVKEIELLKNRIEEEIKALPKDRKLAREFYKAFSKEGDELLKKLSEVNIIDFEDETLKVGDEVLLVNLNEKGKIIDIDGDNYNILTGKLKIWVNKSEIRKIDKVEKKSEQNKINLSYSLPKTDIIPEIDVRGKRVDEALGLIDKFLDRAILSGLDRIKIIHGAGLGKLRESIHLFLKESSVVSSYKLGDAKEKGGSYYTVVELKK